MVHSDVLEDIYGYINNWKVKNEKNGVEMNCVSLNLNQGEGNDEHCKTKDSDNFVNRFGSRNPFDTGFCPGSP